MNTIITSVLSVCFPHDSQFESTQLPKRLYNAWKMTDSKRKQKRDRKLQRKLIRVGGKIIRDVGECPYLLSFSLKI